MKSPKPLDYKSLHEYMDVSQLKFSTTKTIKPLSEFLGQERAVEALNFGIGIQSPGYNLFAMGPSGIGKYALVKTVLTPLALKKPVPSDWCYIYNFDAPEKPIAIELPPGMGITFQQDMKVFTEELLSNVLTVFESDEYRLGIKKINEIYHVKRIRIKKRNKRKISKGKLKEKIPSLYKERHGKEKELKIELLTGVIEPHFRKFKRKYGKFQVILDYLKAVYENIIEHTDDFIRFDEKTNLLTFSLENPALTRYKINLLVDNSNLTGAPIIFEENPSYASLICRIEYLSDMGNLVTNFTLIRPGALHLANGGFLIIEARKLKKNLDAWEALKNALYSKKIKIDPIAHKSSFIKPLSLEPTPIPLNVKVILLGERSLYYFLCQHDPDFTELFKVPVDFNETIDRNPKNILMYARLVAGIIQRENLLCFKASAVAKIIDFSSRFAEDKKKLTTHINEIEDLIMEANYWAASNNKKFVDDIHVKQAINAKIHRMDRAREVYYEEIYRDYIIIKTQGKAVGQVNCLSVRRVGKFTYGHPTRVTARVRLGKGKVIDIQREIKMAGPLHTKAGLIITNFLASRFNQNSLFSLSASIAFEQLYCWTDGDSASVGELAALLSALAEVPIFQFLAVTGSIDQYGDVQAVGGINEKIEGFFDVCEAKGLTGNQGVIIPQVNIQNVLLRDDIMEAIANNYFSIYAINTVDEAIALLTGLPAGVKDKSGKYPKNSIYSKIEHKLAEFTQRRLKKITKISDKTAKGKRDV